MNKDLTAFLSRFSLQARVFFSGNLCNITHFDTSSGAGHLHVLRRGRLVLHTPDGGRQVLTEPSLLFFPRPTVHRFETDARDGADLICASVQFGAQPSNPVIQELPALLTVPLSNLPRMAGVLTLLFDEAFAADSTHAPILNRLSEVVLIYLMRWALEQQLLSSGVVSGLADARLAKALTGMHEHPARNWTLSQLADSAGMSRARFAAHFTATVGKPPGEYLAAWRISLAQDMLANGRPLKSISQDCGYSSTNALSRAFHQQVGMTPTCWLAQHHLGEHPSTDIDRAS